MAGSLSTYAKDQVRKWAMSDSSVTRPTSFDLALYTSAPDDDGGGVEVSASLTGYARQAITFDSDGAANVDDVVFGPALTNWGEITHWGLFTDTAAFWMWGEATTPVEITASKQLTLSAGSFNVTAD